MSQGHPETRDQHQSRADSNRIAFGATDTGFCTGLPAWCTGSLTRVRVSSRWRTCISGYLPTAASTRRIPPECDRHSHRVRVAWLKCGRGEMRSQGPPPVVLTVFVGIANHRLTGRSDALCAGRAAKCAGNHASARGGARTRNRRGGWGKWWRGFARSASSGRDDRCGCKCGVI
jgi:hypothetical protein